MTTKERYYFQHLLQQARNPGTVEKMIGNSGGRTGLTGLRGLTGLTRLTRLTGLSGLTGLTGKLPRILYGWALGVGWYDGLTKDPKKSGEHL